MNTITIRFRTHEGHIIQKMEAIVQEIQRLFKDCELLLLEQDMTEEWTKGEDDDMTRRRRRYTEPVGLTLTKTQLEGLERLVAIKRLRTKQQVLRQLLDKEFDKELGAYW